jgi:glucan 1,3-beta-glucosidase
MRGIGAWAPPIILAAALSVALWAWLGRPVALPPAPEAKLHCASYTPFRGDQTPLDQTLTIPPQQIAEDLKQLKPITNCVRTYAVNQGLDQVVPLAAQLGMKVLLGIWIGSKSSDNELQIKKAVELAHAYPGAIRAIIVGNEVLLRGEQTGETLATLAARVRKESGLPVTYADVWEYWLRAPQALRDSVDFVTIHVLPYWEDQPLPVSAGVAHLQEIVNKVRAAFPGKEVMVGETGWPSAGRWREDAAPSLVNQARYLRDFLVYAKGADLDYNFIEAFDQPWKRWQEGTAGGYWGIYGEDRQPKFSWTDPVTEYPGWPVRATLSVVLGIGILAMVRFWRGQPGIFRRVAASLGAMLTGFCLVLHFPHAWLVSRNDWEWLLECLIGIETLATGTLLIAALLSDRRNLANGSFLEAISWLRHPRRLPEARTVIALLRLAALIGAATVSLGLCFDPRYRDFPLAAYILPAIGFAFADLSGKLWTALPDRREEAVLSLILVGTAGFILWNEGPFNLEAMAWCILTVLLALPGIAAWRGLCLDLKREMKSGRKVAKIAA